MTKHGRWMGFVVGTDRRAVRELPTMTITGRRARRSRPTNDMRLRPNTECRIFSNWGQAVASPPLWINRKLPDGGLGTARPTREISPQSGTPCGVRRLVAALPFSSLISLQHRGDKSPHSIFS